MPRTTKLTEREPGVYTYRNGNALLIDASKTEGGTKAYPPKAANEVDKIDKEGGESHPAKDGGDEKVGVDK